MTGGLVVDCSVEDEGWRRVSGKQAMAHALISACLAADNIAPPAEISILFASDERVRDLNRRFRGQDRPTNVLSFPGPAPQPGLPAILGDVVLAFGTMARQAQAQRISLRQHTAHLVVHGILHLLGHDHQNEAEAGAMEAMETAILRGQGFDTPYETDKSMEQYS